ncbi:hypothetical protein FZEAL_8251 [Fusarium zealandicum]|uniref:NCT transcriptional regulatory complex subunit A n=1 Tax=Fusarium zealandicum TaxID=1053134 RepID=A0A8H4UET1_9HYPO|nr:hypothetical protein FZEAL_8251 [Fusarium zealandicum]
MSTDDSYAPKSPDLSTFYSSGPTQPAPQELQHPQAGSHSSPGYQYKDKSPIYERSASFSSYVPPLLSFNNDNHASDTGHHQDRIHQQHPTQPRSVGSEYQSYSAPHLAAQDRYLESAPAQRISPRNSYGGSLASLIPHQQQHREPPVSYALGYTDQAPGPGVAAYKEPYTAPTGAGALDHPYTCTAAPFDVDMPPRKAAPPPAPEIEPSPVRTKFPTARIKRIMQADEEVGKVAQQTPIAVGKALELFMIQLVSKSADVAKEKGSKRVTASMLKQVVETDEQWDFLRDIVSRVENEKEGSKSRAKQESSSDEEIPEPKKRTRGGRKKKAT